MSSRGGAPFSMDDEAPKPTGPPVLHTTEGRVRVITLNRPEARNALDAATRKMLITNLEMADKDPNVGAIVITGQGTTFAAGADLNELLARGTAEQKAFISPPHIYSIVEGLRKPVIAAINGHALGAGLELATACDIRVCSDLAKVGQPEIQLALIPGGGGTQRLVRLIGHGAASRLVLTGDAIKADEALRIGLVDLVVSPEKVHVEAVKLATAIARHDPEAVAAAKAALWAATEESYAEGLQTEIELFLKLHARTESKARITAFLQRP